METSFDDSNNEYMSLSEADAFDFDQVKTTYLNSLGKPEECAKSVDALIEDDSSFAFIEFKNCQITDRIRKDIRLKLSDSLLIYNDITGTDLSYSREHGEFIIVYSEAKNPSSAEYREKIVSSIMEKAQEELIRFGFDRHKGSYMKDVHTYTERQFAEYILRRSSNQDQPLLNMV